MSQRKIQKLHQRKLKRYLYRGTKSNKQWQAYCQRRKGKKDDLPTVRKEVAKDST